MALHGPRPSDSQIHGKALAMKWRFWTSALALLVALAGCGGGETKIEPLTCSDDTVRCGDSCIDTDSDPRHCGGCDNACAAGEICIEGGCAVACPEGQELCDGTCADISNDPLHCGGCENACAAGEVCVEGGCEVACPEGQEICDGTCVYVDRSNEHCGACGNACEPGQACVDGGCTSVCPQGQELCDGACVDTDTSGQHCGACGVVCDAGQVCDEGACVASCPAGQTDCEGGCFDLDTSAQHCGACGVTCDAGEVCSAGTCAATCGDGLTECNGVCIDTETDRANCGACGTTCDQDELCIEGGCQLHCAAGSTDCDGACVDTDTNPAHCGACGVACEDGQTCQEGSCVAACNPFSPDVCDGTCTNTAVDPMNCGTCGNECGPGLVCDGGACTSFCADDKVDCNGSCTSTDDDPNNCGGCGNVCEGAANGLAVCVEGTCASVCADGFADCNADMADGCETPLTTSAEHCGACGNVCEAPWNGIAGCVDSTCGLAACEPGFEDCDQDPITGCEIDIHNDSNNCGGCGIECGVDEACQAGACVEVAPGDSCDHPLVVGPGQHSLAWYATEPMDYLFDGGSCSSQPGRGADLVMAYTATATGRATVTIDKPANTGLHVVVSGDSCGVVQEIACNAEYILPFGEVTFPITAGQTYYVYVVDSTSGPDALTNPLDVRIEELDCATYVPAIVEVHPPNGALLSVDKPLVVVTFDEPVTPYGELVLTGSSGTTITVPMTDPQIEIRNDSRTIHFRPGTPLTTFSGGTGLETFTATLTDVQSNICTGQTMDVPAWSFTLAEGATCALGQDGLVNGTVHRMEIGLQGAANELFLVADEDPNGWVYLGGSSILYRLRKTNGFAENVHTPAGLTSSHLGYGMNIDGSNLYIFEGKTSGTDGFIWRISSDGGQSWNVEDVALFPQAPNGQFRGPGAVVDGRLYHVTSHAGLAGMEMWSVDVTGAFPAPARLEARFGADVLSSCSGLAADARYFYTNCRTRTSPDRYFQVRIDRTTWEWTTIYEGFDYNANAMHIHVIDTSGDGIADIAYLTADDAIGWALCGMSGASGPGGIEVYDLNAPGGSSAGNYGLAFDKALNVLWAYFDDDNELVRIE